MMRRQVLLSWSGGKDSALSLQEQRFQRSDDLQHTAHDLALLGGPGPFVIGAGLYTAGRLTRMPSLARGALHMTAAFLLAASDLRRPGMGRIVRVGSRLRKRQYDLLDDAQAALDARLRH